MNQFLLYDADGSASKAPAAGARIRITDMFISAGATASVVTISQVVNSTPETLFVFSFSANSGIAHSFNDHLVLPVDAVLSIDATEDASVTIIGYEETP